MAYSFITFCTRAITACSAAGSVHDLVGQSGATMIALRSFSAGDTMPRMNDRP
jgi:hypothetical protein